MCRFGARPVAVDHGDWGAIMSRPANAARTAILTLVAMCAFAANSLLCRLALGRDLIDPASFTSLRVASGAAILCLIVLLRGKTGKPRRSANWRAPAALFAYMAFFSFAYLTLSAGTGALILFATVQLTMFVVAVRDGERFAMMSWAGLILAVLGLIYLVSPGIAAPNPLGAALMAIAGIAWGFYSLLGRAAANPLGATAWNFSCALPLVLLVSFVFLPDAIASVEGIVLAVSSGAIASGCGYVIWYAALSGLTASRAATVQLSVPIIAAFGGIALLSEDITLRLVISSLATLGGITMVLAQRASIATPQIALESRRTQRTVQKRRSNRSIAPSDPWP